MGHLSKPRRALEASGDTVHASAAIPTLELRQLVEDVADAVVLIDRSRVPFKHFQPGVGPYGEPQLVRAVAERLNDIPHYAEKVRTKRCPDLLVQGSWAVEVKLARPFGDNGREAENWSVNLLHPYMGNVSALGDCLKLREMPNAEKKAVLVIGYEHTPPRIPLAPLIAGFELLARDVCAIALGSRIEARRTGLVHPVHQQAVIAAWEVECPPNIHRL